MRQINFYLSVAITLALLIALTEVAIAKPASRHDPRTQAGPHSGKMYGKGAPFQIEDLPARSHLRHALERLSRAGKLKAMRRLHEFSFPEADIESLEVDQEGGVFYSDTVIPEPVASNSAAATSETIALPPVDVFKLHSLPGAAKKVFLDFDGHVISGTAWNSTNPTLNALPFDIDGDPNSFNAEELNRIHEIWHRVAEDYAPFAIDVTTEEPSTFGPSVGRVLFTNSTDASGLAMPSQYAGGVAYINVFGGSKYASYYSPALVYYNNLSSGYAPYVAEAAAHEFGHNLGLSHDGTSDVGYYSGLGSGHSSWGPIMGLDYYTNVTQWSKGEYPDANNTQDDISIIANKLTFRADDHGNALGTASLLAVESDGSILATNPQNDPGNSDPLNKGIIEKQGDIDVFAFDADGGTVNITVTPAWAAFTRSGDTNDQSRGANLDVKATLYDASGSVVTDSDPLDDTNAVISASVNAGRYYLAITGVGNSSTPYSSYGSEGEFFITGAVPPPSFVADTTPPSPAPAWQSAPIAQSESSIAMTSTLATDASGVVEYRFICVAGGNGCVNSAWQSSPNYVIGGLTAGTSYTFQVVARDAAGNQTPASSMASATTLTVTSSNPVNDAPIALPDSDTVRLKRSVSINVLGNDSDVDGDNLTIISSTKGTIVNGKSISYKGLILGTDTFTYTVSDGKGGTASATVTVTVSK
ncbi:Ig-like domain-containing protein [Methylomicrobium lacus]|uniref:Ig-like domain-containing protein n=1 Tax=Methylomicrobium lacus TaxID=136992 RepID=UPI0035A94F5E